MRERARALWRRIRWILRPPRGLRITREGRYYVAFSIGVGIAALNTGNNLLFLILGLQLSAIIVSGLLSEAVIAELEVERILPAHATAGQPALIGLRVSNHSRRVTSLSVTVDDRAVGGRASFVRLPPGESVEASYRFTPGRRGKLVFEEVRLVTRFPFGLFEKWRVLRRPGTLVVFPAPLAAEATRRRPAAREGEHATQRAGQGTEFHALRDYRTGDDARSIHWRTTAKTGELVVVERQRDHRRRVALLVDNRSADERALDRACSIAAHLARRACDEGAELALALAGGAHLAPAFGAEQLRCVLTALALLEPARADAAPPRAPASWGADAMEVAA